MRLQSPGYSRAIVDCGRVRIPSLDDPIRPIAEVELLDHYEHDVAACYEVSPCTLVTGPDPLVNGNFEGAAGPPPAGWVGWNGVGTREPGTCPDGGNFVGRLSFDGVNAYGWLYQAVSPLVPNQIYLVQGWIRTDGVGIPAVEDGMIAVWTGIASNGWQWVYGLTSGMGVDIAITCANLAAGVWVEAGVIYVTPLNISLLRDRTRRGGRDPVQAVAASRPVLTLRDTPSGRDSAAFDGTADYMKTPAFTLVQPHTILITKKWAGVLGRYLIDGDAASSTILDSGGPNDYYAYAGLWNLHANMVGGAWELLQAVFSGASSLTSTNNNAPVTGDAGPNNANGITLCAAGNSLGGFANASIAVLIAFNRSVINSDNRRLSLSVMRRLGV